MALEKKLKPDGIIDWDGTVIPMGSFCKTLIKGSENDLSKKIILYTNWILYGMYEVLGKDNKEQFKNMLSVLRPSLFCC